MNQLRIERTTTKTTTFHPPSQPSVQPVVGNEAEEALVREFARGLEVLTFGLASFSTALAAVAQALGVPTASANALKGTEYFNLARGIIMGAVKRYRHQAKH